MQIGDEALKEFKALYQAEFGKEIPQQDVLEMATRLINLYLTIYRPLPGERRGIVTPPSGACRVPDASFPNVE
ncbi:MAG: hypothetical protein ABL962_14180 [Fimbriimonadaceae bacterium]